MSSRYDNDDGTEELSDDAQQKEYNKLQQMAMQGLTDSNFPDGRPLDVFSDNDS